MARRKTPAVLVLAGSDPSGGAGLEADLKTLHQHGVAGMAIPTLLTVQNRREVTSVRFLDPDFAARQWHALFAERRPDAVKVGALGSAAMVRRVTALLQSPEARGIPVVLDPVLGSTSGAALLEPKAFPALKRLLRLCRVVTPNAPEFAALCGRAVDAGNAKNLLRAFCGSQSFAVLLKGGHFKGRKCDDLLFDRGRLIELRASRLPEMNFHGTGCVLASSIAAHLALRRPLADACRRAKAFVREAMAAGAHSEKPRNGAVLNLWVKA
jgi:hydroxymethylpyrimidine/phosphomethylpyrimidine kinase